jgi:hypothetical protein
LASPKFKEYKNDLTRDVGIAETNAFEERVKTVIGKLNKSP